MIYSPSDLPGLIRQGGSSDAYIYSPEQADALTKTCTDPAYCVTLVHGTFSDSNIWQPVFLEAIGQELRAVVFFGTFGWSGANSQRKRIDASQLLQQHLTELTRAYPFARHFIIGHSHGGTVALYAIRHPRVQRSISGIVCLGTPFFAVRARAIWLSGGLMVGGLIATFGAFGLYFFASGFIYAAVYLGNEQEFSFWYLAGMIVFGYIVISLLKIAISPNLIRTWIAVMFGPSTVFLTRWQNRVLARYPRLQLGKVGMLYVFFEKKDSAHRWLRLWGHIADLPRLFLSWVVLPCALLGNAILMLGALWEAKFIPSVPGIRGVFWIFAEVLRLWLWLLIAIANAGFLAGVVQLLAILSGFVRNRVWSFGREGIWASWLISIHSKQDPLFQDRKAENKSSAIRYPCDLEQIRSEGSLLKIMFRNYHSFYYRSPEIGRQIARWIATQDQLFAKFEASDDSGRL